MKKNKLIVGIGASAGGLEALELFFKNMPDDSNMAFIVVVHLDPTHVSMLPDLLQRQTKMPVIQIQDGMTVEVNKIYVIPPNNNLSIINGKLALIEPLTLHTKLPIDYFFRSLALDQMTNAVGIILSGTGSDGALGLKEIKAENGLIMAQSLDSAKYDGMPKSAIATGMVDYVLAPEMMPKQLLHYAQDSLKIGLSDEIASFNVLHKILILIRNHTGRDFSLYKKNTIFRRIERRMQVHQLQNINDYFELLKKNNQEIMVLFRELLIGVTSFFRDKEAFEILKNDVIPSLLEDKPDNYTMRIWVPGCSTGEEVYSIAIIVHECIVQTRKNIKVQIFGTDLDEFAIAKARAGLYSTSIIADLGEEYCQKYFSLQDHQYRINKSIRETIVFAVQNVIEDPPFTKLDMISCRNLLIYFGPELQKKILPTFHYSLKQEGVLFLGPSETTGQSNAYFEIVDKKWKIFKRKFDNNRVTQRFHITEPVRQLKVEANPTTSTISQLEELSALQLVETILKRSDVAPCVVIDSHSNIIYVHGRLGHYLEPAEGRVSSQILDMVRSPVLKHALAGCISEVALHKKPCTKKAISCKVNGHTTLVDIIINPLENIGNLKGLMMVTFAEIPLNRDITAKNTTSSSKGSAQSSSLQQELESTRENLQTTIEELETSNEELKSSNEELQSTNEELQSTNEELETSKEELQSLNEESVTVNAELQSHIDNLSTTNDDIKNLFDSTQVATLFLDAELKIRRYTPKVADIINLVAADINRPLGHISSRLRNVNLIEHSQAVLKTLEKYESEVQDEANNYYRLRIHPYRTVNNVIDGVVISFEDITTLKCGQIALKKSEQRYKSLFEHCPVAVLELNVSKLVSFIDQQALSGENQFDDFWANHAKESDDFYQLIEILQVNERGRILLFDADKNDNKQRFNAENYLYHQLGVIMNKEDNVNFDSVLETASGKKLNCQITITTPRIDDKLNFESTILAITPK